MWQLLVLAFKGLPFSVEVPLSGDDFRAAIKSRSLIRAPFQTPPKIVVIATKDSLTSFLFHMSPLAILKPVYKAELQIGDDKVSLTGRFILGASVRLGIYLALLAALAYEGLAIHRFIRVYSESIRLEEALGFAIGMVIAPIALLIMLSIGAQILRSYRGDIETIAFYFSTLAR